MLHLRPLAAALAAALVLVSCSDEGSPLAPGRLEPAITPVASIAADTLTVGDTVRIRGALVNPSGRELPHAKKTSWRSDNPAVATVDASGLVTAAAKGSAVVTLEYKNRRADTVHILVRLPEEARALWVNRFEYTSAAKIVEIMENAKNANFNVVYFQVRGQGDAYYRSTLEPCAVGLCGALGRGAPPYDPLRTAIDEAHKRGIELHAWVNALTGFSSPAGTGNAAFCRLLVPSQPGSPNHMLIDHPEWAMVDTGGRAMTCQNSQAAEYAYVNPAIPAVRAHLAAVAAEIVRSYGDVDGIHLDRIRYPNYIWSYDTASDAAFRERYWRDPRRPTRFTLVADPQYNQFRRDMVSLAVREVHDAITAVKPSIVLSAAVWPIYDRDKFGWPSSTGFQQYFQDPRAWAGGRYFDVQVPMTYFRLNAARCSYTLDNPDWACLLDDHLAGFDAATGRHTYVGLTATPPGVATGAPTVTELERQIAYGRERGVKGFALYSYNGAVARGLFSALAAGAFARPTDVPLMPWKSAGAAGAGAASRAPSGAPGTLSGFLRSAAGADDASWVEPVKEFEEEPNVDRNWAPGAQP